MNNGIIGDFDFSVVQLQENDIIVLTFDINHFDIETCEQIFKIWNEMFPDKVLVKFAPYMDACIVRDVE